jgi:hypothetical protein
MRIHDLSYQRDVQEDITGGLTTALSGLGASASALGRAALTQISAFTSAQTSLIAIQSPAPGSPQRLILTSANSISRAKAISVAAPLLLPGASGLLASGRATVLSSGLAQS